MKTAIKTTGLRYWMLRVLEECDHVAADFSADPVHDLRVALRRCRSVADGLLAMDPDPAWKAMKKAGKELFQSLGELRDLQIMMEWIEKLEPATTRVGAGDPPAPPSSNENSGNIHSENIKHSTLSTELINQDARDPATALLEILHRRETEQKKQARVALEEFDRKQWRQWSKSLPQRAARFRPGSALFKHLALERWMAARDLHTLALRNRSQVALHTLRIGIKRFRYIVENFLPAEHKAWSDDLKDVQDMLGEVHDLDVLWSTMLSCHIFATPGARQRWRARIVEARNKRVERYRAKMVGPDSLWQVWRAALPQGEQIQALATHRMKLWASVLDPDSAHSERVTRFALDLYDGLKRLGLISEAAPGKANGIDARFTLQVAAMLHDVGKSKGNKGHHKKSFELMREHHAPFGWEPEMLRRAAIVARFYHGALPRRNHKTLRDLLPGEQRTIIQLAAILRLANAFDATHDGHIKRIRIEDPGDRKRHSDGLLRKPTLARNEAIVITAEGYVTASSTAQIIAAERYSLEANMRRPVMMKAMTGGPRVRTAPRASGLKTRSDVFDPRSN